MSHRFVIFSTVCFSQTVRTESRLVHTLNQCARLDQLNVSLIFLIILTCSQYRSLLSLLFIEGHNLCLLLFDLGSYSRPVGTVLGC